MIGSLVGVSALTGLLGAGRREQLLAAGFAASIPMGVLQATSTQNDYVITLWLVCLAYFVLLSKKRELEPVELLSISLGTGLGTLTKGTFYPYALPFLLWYFIPRLVKIKFRKTLFEGFAFALIVLVLNLGFWTRNIITYGMPLGPLEWIGARTEIQVSPRTWVPTIAKQVALNFVTPIPKLNTLVISAVESVHNFFGVEIDDFRPIISWNHEDLAANPIHMLLVIFTLPVFILTWGRAETRLAFRYTLIVLTSFLVFLLVVAFDEYGVRLHLPFFVLWGTVFGIAAHLANLKKFTYLVAVCMLITSIPWLLLNRSRPIIGLYPYTMMKESVFREPPEVVLFANFTYLRGPYIEVAEAIKSMGCEEVGLKIDSHDIEYPFWWLLNAPQSGIRIEAVETYPHLERYIDPSFKPCAIICRICGDRENLHGLERQDEFGEGIVLFAGSGYTPDED